MCASDQEYCAFETVVNSSRGTPVANIVVSIKDRAGQEYASARTDLNGVARLCDAPPGAITLSVGGNRCGAVSISHLSRYVYETRQVHITYDNCTGEEWVIPAECRRILRITDQKSHPLASAKVTFLDGIPPSTPPVPADHIGRAVVFLKFGQFVSIQAEASGYQPRRLAISCERSEPTDDDIGVVLSRRTSAP
jgi:hypothetical protein